MPRPNPATPTALARAKKDVAVVVDRLAKRTASRSRIVDSVETAYRHADGHCLVHTVAGECLRFSDRMHCAACDRPTEAPTPQLFSFNSPLGACPVCNGFGNTIDLDPDLVFPAPAKTRRFLR